MQSILFTAALLSTAVSGYILPRQSVCGSTSSINHTIVAGDTLGSLATTYSSGICDIARANLLPNPNLVVPDQVLVIPTNCTTPDNTSCLTSPDTCVKGLGSTYDVRAGDGFAAIAANFNITVAALQAANPQITDINVIYAGEVIDVPVCPCSACGWVGTYNIAAGDSFFALATTYHTTIGQILALNVGVNATALQVGQQIILPKDCKNVTAHAA